MPLDEPSWWYRNPQSIVGQILQPVAWIYGSIAARRFQREPSTRLPIPVICIGNFTAGGTGKTPLAIWMARCLADMQLKPVFLSRGYGGRMSGPHLVQPDIDRAIVVGDEPLLLAAHAPVVVAKDRGRGGTYIVSQKLGDVIIMDDGLQNPSLHKDLVVSVVSAERGVGNAKVIPAGPLRAPLAQQLARTDVIVVNQGTAPSAASEGATHSQLPAWRPEEFGGLVAAACVRARDESEWVRDRPLLAFAGIGNPDRFFNLLHQLGGDVCQTRTYRDHQPISDDEAIALVRDADELGCQLVTTEKDIVRLDPTSAPQAALREQCRAVGIELTVIENETQLRSRIKDAVAKA